MHTNVPSGDYVFTWCTPCFYLILAIAFLIAGCTDKPRLQPESMQSRPVAPTLAKDAARQSLGAFAKRRLQFDEGHVICSVVKTSFSGVPAQEAPNLEATFETCFSLLMPAGIYYIPADMLLKITSGPPQLLATYANADGSPPRILLFRIRASLDRSVRSSVVGNTVQALLTQQGKYLQPEADTEFEQESSRLTVSIIVQNPNGYIDQGGTDLSCELVRSRNGVRLAMLWGGSGASRFEQVIITDGLNSAVDTMVARGLLVVLGRELSVDYWRCGFGQLDEQVIERFAARDEPGRSQIASRILQANGFSPELRVGLPMFLASRGMPANDRLDAGAMRALLLAYEPPAELQNAVGTDLEVILDDLKNEPALRDAVLQRIWSTPGVRAVDYVDGKPTRVRVTAEDPGLVCDGVRSLLESGYDFVWTDGSLRVIHQ